MNRVTVLGCPGSGKSYFCKKLSKLTALPLHHLDNIWHKHDKTTITEEEFDSRLFALLNEDKWIIDGNYSRTIESRLEHANKIFLFDLPTEQCIEAIESRMGKPRDDIPWIEYDWDLEFKEFVLNFSNNKLPNIYKLLDQYSSKVETTIFYSREDANKYLEDLKRARLAELNEALRQINSTIHKLKETVKTLSNKDKPARYKSQITLANRRIAAFSIAVDLIETDKNNVEDTVI